MTDRLMMRALRREKLERPPVWLMRQAGRYLPEYREVRAEAGGFLNMCHQPELAAEVTLQPIRRFGMDGAVIFSDILLPLAAMGMELVFDHRGPVLPTPLRDESAVDGLRTIQPKDELPYVGEALRRVRAELPDETTLIGFAGAPFTLASYAVEGGTSKQFAALRTLMYREPAIFEKLLDRLAEAVGAHLLFQIESGADVVMVFDTWAGILGKEDYGRFAAPATKRVLDIVGDAAPRLVFSHGADHLLESLASLPTEGVGVDYRTPMAEAFERVGDRVALQGNLDPACLLSRPEDVAARTRTLLDEVGGRPGHVMNLGHGVFKETDPESVAAFVETVRGSA